MKVMLIVKATAESETGVMPSPEQIAEMNVFNQDLISRGILLDAAGMEASAGGARVHFDGDARRIEQGPFANTTEIISGFWFIRVDTIEEATELARKVPFRKGTVEVRRVWEPADYAA